jgi:multiple antibiotic resistance protein
MSYELLISAFTTMIVMYDPPGMAAIFLGLTSDMDRHQRVQVALRACLIAFVILTVFVLVGSSILTLLGISLGAFRIAGGLLLFWIAFEMLFEKRQERHEKSAKTAVTKDQIANIAIFPMAIPLIAGPGAISAVILLAGSFEGPSSTAMLIGVVLCATLTLFLSLVVADRLDQFLETTGRLILTRLLGLILAAVAVQFVIDGINSTWF